MEWIKIELPPSRHNRIIEIYVEIGQDRYETRRIEKHDSGKWYRCSENLSSDVIFLGEDAFPEINEFNSWFEDENKMSTIKTIASNISKDGFELLWNKVGSGG